MSTKDGIPPGFKLRRRLQGHTDVINRIAWSPDGQFLASPSFDRSIRIWNAQTGLLSQNLIGHKDAVTSVAWSPNGEMLASSSADQTIRLWNIQTGRSRRPLQRHTDTISTVAWSPNENILASGSRDKTICLWDTQTGQHLHTFTGHADWVYCLAWSPDGEMLASGSTDGTIRFWNMQIERRLFVLTKFSSRVTSIAWSPDGKMLASSFEDHTICLWDISTKQEVQTLESHSNLVSYISFSYDGRLLASKSSDRTVRIWRTDTWEEVAILKESTSDSWLPGLAFHPHAPILATLDKEDMAIRLWDLDVTALLKATSANIHYRNAKVILVGDSGVGKTGLSLRLTGNDFVATESTHGRYIWTFDRKEIDREGQGKEIREALLWDLAGQPGYRLIHQLYLNEAAVALVVFDAHSDTDPFAGVDHWVRALRMAQEVQGSSAPPIKKFLVAARIDRGTKRASRERIDKLVQKLGFDGYFETSAREEIGIAELATAIREAIDWNNLTGITSSTIFQRIKTFLVVERDPQQLLTTVDNLYRAFLRSNPDVIHTFGQTKGVSSLFRVCIRQVESKGLIRQLSFGDLILLQPELLDGYASALINAASSEPDGLGSIVEEDVHKGRFLIPTDIRIADEEQEKLLLLAMIENLLRYEIALREQGNNETLLIFPSQSTRENFDLPDPEGSTVIFRFEGPVINIYATLAVRLSHSGLFQRTGLWKNAVTYTTRLGGTYGLSVKTLEEGLAEFTLFFDEQAGKETRFHFEEYVNLHLQRRALPGTIKRRCTFVCPNPECRTPVSDIAVTRRRQRGFDWILCNVCQTVISLFDSQERLQGKLSDLLPKIDQVADERRNREVNNSILAGKKATNDFDVFLCHNNEDKSTVKSIGEQLKERGILPWLDEWELQPGLPWQRLLEMQIEQIKSAAVFVGQNGIGPWERMELDTFLRQFVNRGVPVIPVILADAPSQPKLPDFLTSQIKLPVFLNGMTWVDFRKQDPDPMKQLIWGITGKREPD